MSGQYEVITPSVEEQERLRRVYDDLLELSGSRIPAIRSAGRAALAHVAQALNGEGIAYELYSNNLPD